MSDDLLAIAPVACCCIGCVSECCLDSCRTIVFIVVVGVKIADLVFNILILIETMDELNTVNAYMSTDSNSSDTDDWQANWNTSFETDIWNTGQNTTWNTTWNTTNNRTYCIFDIDYDISEKVDLLDTLLTTYKIYIGIAGFILLVYMTMWLLIACKFKKNKGIGNMWKALGKFQIYLALAYDIPMNTIAIELQWVKGGSSGIDCWLCSKDPTCSDLEPLRLVSPLKLLSDNQQERTAADLWLSLGISSLSTLFEMMTLAKPYFFSTSSCYLLCCVNDKGDTPGKCCVLWYLFAGIFAGIHVQMTNILLLYFHLLPQGDFPWQFQYTVAVVLAVAFSCVTGDFFLTCCGSCCWCWCCKDSSSPSYTKALAYFFFVLSFILMGVELFKILFPLNHPKDSYIMIMVVGGAFVLTCIMLLLVVLAGSCSDSETCMSYVDLLVNYETAFNKVGPLLESQNQESC
ncbi:uncharacterized protein LOC106156746 [Lingula anatina]|uniref:Uncharacterized protein LOC106156746 n=1 Tax=Lingula anatina TaxID=7574 RepID=A0A1S3HPY7_LINAN|nr:uncharacterized protein LOC106156746 [Lingula anatina]|eukprot:XP_013387606.1 uncharacterized protein LOC106156746 [Lingula anatina]